MLWSPAAPATVAAHASSPARRVPVGVVEVVLSYCHCCLVDRTLLELLPYLADQRVGVINASILSMGLLTKQVPAPPSTMCCQHQQGCRGHFAAAAATLKSLSAAH